ncbi:MAG: MFS transporter, partial [Pseudomonadota bacterium]
MAELSLRDAQTLPRWRRPEALLLLMSMAVWFGLSLWMVLINNFAVEIAAFDGSDIGWLQTVREIPGFLAFLVVFVIRVIPEQRLALISLVLLGGATMVTSQFPTFWGLLFTTFIGSLGFHYFETVNQSLQLQWLSKDRAPQALGWIVAAASVGSLIAYGGVALGGQFFEIGYHTFYYVGGG